MANSATVAEQQGTGPAKNGDSFAGDALRLVGGATLAQALSIVVAPILARMFAPDAFGTAAVFASLLQIISVVACLRYELAIMLPEKDQDAAYLLVGSLFFVGLVTLLTALGVALLGAAIAEWLKAPGLERYLWMLPIAVMANGTYIALRYWNTRGKNFGLLSGVSVLSSAGQAVTKVGGGLLGFTSAGTLIGANLLGRLVPAMGLGWRTWRQSHPLLSQASWRRVTKQLDRYRKFPLVSTWSGLLNTLSVQLPVILLSTFFTQTVVGYYALGMRVVGLPMSLVGNAIGQVFFQRASVAHRSSTLGVLVEDAIIRLTALGLYPMLVLALVGQDLFTIVFGPQWAEAGVYVQILSLWRLMVFIGSPITVVYVILERQGAGLFINVILILSRLASLAAGGELGSARLALLLYAGLGVLIWIVLLAWLIWLSGARFPRVLSGVAACFLYAVPGLTALSAAKWWMQWPVWAVVGIAALGGLLNYALVSVRDPAFRDGLISVWRRWAASR